MRNLSKSLIAFLLSFVFIISAFLPVTAVESRASGTQPTKYSSQYNSGQRDVVCTTLDGTSADDYYTGSYEYDVLDDYSGTTLYNMLQTLMRTTHTYKSTYDDCHYKADRTDCENEDGKVVLIYTSYSATMNQWNGWNREHVWPKSLGGQTQNNGTGGADLHHIRPSDAVVNSTRNNYKYGYAVNGSAKYGSNPASGYLGGYLGGGYFEPLDHVKGDVARICLYVYVRWGSDWGASNITSVFQSVDVLLEWCALDPVDTWEMGRNEVIQDIQGNRNVFIDYPELAWLIFNREIPDGMTTPSGSAVNGSQGGSGSGDQGGGDEGGDTSCAHQNTEIRNAKAPTCGAAGYTGDTYCTDCNGKISSGSSIAKTEHQNTEVREAKAPTCTADGYSGDTYCNDCGQKVGTGSSIEATGHHFNDWMIVDLNKSHERHCDDCGAIEVLDLETLLSYAENDAQKILILMMLGLGDCLALDSLSNQ